MTDGEKKITEKFNDWWETNIRTLKDFDCFVEIGKSLIDTAIDKWGGSWNSPGIGKTGLSHAYVFAKWEKDLKDPYKTIEAIESGVEMRGLYSEMWQTLVTGGHIWLCRLKPEFEPYRAKLISSVIGYIGTRYDYPGLLTYNVPQDALIHHTFTKKEMFCSAVPWWAFRDNSILWKEAKPWRPVDLPVSGFWNNELVG